ncbi:hypothetical protein F0562_004268 [Nyssa sinensis]|uniref:Uncharacterized protein n=1 Tax=Nyssa sinensis TaxID=561372 RepID=A0A5J5BY45_9ASTE|nr:hypothetical protein F0562_004268 [Nyssa sinensis]
MEELKIARRKLQSDTEINSFGRMNWWEVGMGGDGMRRRAMGQEEQWTEFEGRGKDRLAVMVVTEAEAAMATSVMVVEKVSNEVK